MQPAFRFVLISRPGPELGTARQVGSTSGQYSPSPESWSSGCGKFEPLDILGHLSGGQTSSLSLVALIPFPEDWWAV
jgi:hypothetical protein